MTKHSAGGRSRGAVTLVCAAVLGLLAVLVLPGIAVAAPRAAAAPAVLPMDDDSECRHDGDTIYIPRDIQGYAYNFYCRNGQHGIFRHDGYKDVAASPDDAGWFKNINKFKEWANKHSNADGTVAFSQLENEPCVVFEREKAKDKDWDLERSQCADLKNMSTKKKHPCDDWKTLVDGLHKKEPKKYEQWDDIDDTNLDYCVTDNPIFQKAYRAMVWEDENDYDTHDYSAPEGLQGYLGQMLGIAMWIGITIGVLGVLICAGQMAFAYRSGGEGPTVGIMWVLVACVMIGSASAIPKLVLF